MLRNTLTSCVFLQETSMNLYYAIGGGLGHLTRAAAFLHQQKIANKSLILTASLFAPDKRITGEIKTIFADENFVQNKKNYRDFLRKVLTENKIEKIFLDCFPVGIIGEFADFDFQNIEVNYLARLLKWNKYFPLIKNSTILFEQTFILENLENEHQKFIDNSSKIQTDFVLNYPFLKLSKSDKNIIRGIIERHKSFWLVVHSGNAEECSELVSYAREKHKIESSETDLILISPNKIKDKHLFQYNLYPASVLFEKAEKIFTGCGFNAMNQLKDFRHKHYFLPFSRRYDNQFARAKSCLKHN